MLVVHLVVLPEIGNVTMTVPRPSAIMLDAAEGHVRRAVKLRKQLPNQTRRGRWIQPGMEIQFSNEDLVYDFLQEAMASVLLMHTALDNFANEQIPSVFSMRSSSGQTVGRAQIEGYWSLPRKLDVVLPLALGKESLRTVSPPVWAQLTTLKELRDSLGHIHYEETYTGPEDDPASSVFSRLFAAYVSELFEAIETTIAHYT